MRNCLINFTMKHKVILEMWSDIKADMRKKPERLVIFFLSLQESSRVANSELATSLCPYYTLNLPLLLSLPPWSLPTTWRCIYIYVYITHGLSSLGAGRKGCNHFCYLQIQVLGLDNGKLLQVTVELDLIGRLENRILCSILAFGFLFLKWRFVLKEKFILIQIYFKT